MDELTRRLAQGEHAAFAQLYDLYADRLHHYLTSRVASRDDAADILQEVFVRIVRHCGRFGQVDNPTAYLFQMARHEALRWLSRRTARQKLQCGLEELFEEAVDPGAAQQELVDWARAVLNDMSDRDREIVELKLYAGLTFQEVATVMQLPTGTFASGYRRALQKARCGQEHFDDG